MRAVHLDGLCKYCFANKTKSKMRLVKNHNISFVFQFCRDIFEIIVCFNDIYEKVTDILEKTKKNRFLNVTPGKIMMQYKRTNLKKHCTINRLWDRYRKSRLGLPCPQGSKNRKYFHIRSHMSEMNNLFNFIKWCSLV